MEKSTIYNPQSTIPKRCDNCFFSTYIVGIGRPVLSCKQKAGFVGRFRSLALGGSCRNFYPSTTFKLGNKAVRRIPLTCGKFALVDSQDYYRLGQFQWFSVFGRRTFYAGRRENGKTIKMHRAIMDAPSGLVVDHIDHDGLNNCKANLRLCSVGQNNCNVISRRGGASKYKGVNCKRARKKWIASIQHNGTKYHLGYFTDEIAAARVYDKKAKELHGQFACLNFPP
jgi:hypothetical protein